MNEILSLKDVVIEYDRKGEKVRAVAGVDLGLRPGEILGLVGESGCGKSTLGKAMVGILKPAEGEITFDGERVKKLTRGRRPKHFRNLQMIFQDPYGSLNPRRKIGVQVIDGLLVGGMKKSVALLKAAELLGKVGLPEDAVDRFPHQFSGGQRQRISIARALSSEPEFLVCDEPTSALDVSVQAQILNLMKDLQRRLGLTYLFISHNLAVVYHVSDRIGVMYLGRLCEVATASDLFKNPQHPYTQLLLNTIPDMEMTGIKRDPVHGEVPTPIDPPSGCTFHPRCPLANDRCKKETPQLQKNAGSLIACHAVEEKRNV